MSSYETIQNLGLMVWLKYPIWKIWFNFGLGFNPPFKNMIQLGTKAPIFFQSSGSWTRTQTSRWSREPFPMLAKGAAVPKPKPIPTVKAVVTKKAKAADWRMVTPWSRPMVDGHRGLETNGWTAEVWHIEGCSFFGSFSPRWWKFKHGKDGFMGLLCCI